MIDIDKLTPADIGRWVSYCILPPHRDHGRIKSWSKQFVYVVFRCGGNWDDFADYTAAPTLAEYLEFDEERESGPKKGNTVTAPSSQNAILGHPAKPFL